MKDLEDFFETDFDYFLDPGRRLPVGFDIDVGREELVCADMREDMNVCVMVHFSQID